MKFKEEKIEVINNTCDEKKKANPISRHIIGIGIRLDNSVSKTIVLKDNWAICEVEELSQMIKELTMMKEAIEEETGLVL